MVSTRFVLVIIFWSYQCLPDFLMSAMYAHAYAGTLLMPIMSCPLTSQSQLKSVQSTWHYLHRFELHNPIQFLVRMFGCSSEYISHDSISTVTSLDSVPLATMCHLKTWSHCFMVAYHRCLQGKGAAWAVKKYRGQLRCSHDHSQGVWLWRPGKYYRYLNYIL